MFAIIPGLIAAGSALFGAIGGKKASEKEATASLQDRYRYDVLREQAFDPYAPFRRGARGAMWAALMKTWGFDKMFPKEMMERVSNPLNVPGTGSIPGGTPYPTGPEGTGVPAGKRGGGFWDYLGMGLGAADIFGRSLGPGGGGGGGVPSGIPGESMDQMAGQRPPDEDPFGRG